MSSSRTLRITLYAVLIFLAGAITGAFVAPLFGRHFMRPPDPRQMSEHMMARLKSGLHLTGAQAEQIRPLLERTGKNLETIRRETTRQVLDRVALTNKEVLALLTPAQQIEFNKMENEHRQRLRHVHPWALPPDEPPPALP
ncbi:MAG: hypothetical protein ACR2G0_01455 [Chthoniobacterales bacterium]